MSRLRVGENWRFTIPGLKDYKIRLGTILEVTEDAGPGSGPEVWDRTFRATVTFVPKKVHENSREGITG